jgi:hypothetical protein
MILSPSTVRNSQNLPFFEVFGKKSWHEIEIRGLIYIMRAKPIKRHGKY